MKHIATTCLATACAIGALACGNDDIASTRAPLQVECAAATDIPESAWTCSNARVMTCSELVDATLYVPEGDALACEDNALQLSDEGPFAPGTHVITVQSDNGEVCSSELTVVDTTPPAIEAHTIALWPPNHRLVTIDIDECVTTTDDCGDEVKREVLWVSSDEPSDATGDGSHEPDVLQDDCGNVSVRAERQGGGDGRVYTLGVRVTDASGNATEGTCHVVVPHDQRRAAINHAAIDSGESYRVSFNDDADACDEDG